VAQPTSTATRHCTLGSVQGVLEQSGGITALTSADPLPTACTTAVTLPPVREISFSATTAWHPLVLVGPFRSEKLRHFLSHAQQISAPSSQNPCWLSLQQKQRKEKVVSTN
jgi:hypothetical protein